ncbi:MAG: hypothetical protein EB127_14700 [Alphaproteobacteria bacterium]|nr:hypothetical protein [Alphaproteobacteria bacterium]
METKFKVLYENMLERYQQGGFIIGDRVRFRKDCLKLDYFKNKGRSFLDIVEACMDPKFDLNLRVSAVKSIYPTTSQNYRGGTESPDSIYVDVIVEYAPGLYRTPMTVPIEALELQDDGINTGPVPDSIKRKSKIHGPEKVEAESDVDFDINLSNKNVKIPGGKKWNDKQPGAGNTPKKY